MITTLKEIKRNNVNNFFIVELESEGIHNGQIDWENDSIFLNGDEINDTTIEEFFDKLDYLNTIKLYFTKLDAISRTENDFVVVKVIEEE